LGATGRITLRSIPVTSVGLKSMSGAGTQPTLQNVSVGDHEQHSESSLRSCSAPI
jgi:hypothetical protein